MSDKRLPNSNPQVKRKVRTVPDGMRLTITEVRGFPKRTRGPDKNLLVKIRRRYIKYIAACPYLNSNEKLVINKIAEWFNLSDGFARAAHVTLAESVGVSPRTVRRAIKTAYDAGLMGIKSGGPSIKGSFGPVANKYVPAFRLVINAANSLLIENAPYHFLPRKVNGEAKSLGQKSLGQVDLIVETLNPNVETKSLGQIGLLHANVGGAQEAPPSATPDGSASGSAPRLEDSVKPLPTNHIWMDMKSDLFIMLASRDLPDGMDPDQLRNIIEDKGEVGFLRPWCEDKTYSQLPPDGVPFAHIIIYGDKTPMTCEEGDCGTIKVCDLQENDWVAVECRNMTGRES